jgi:hypothetical protein
MLKNGTIQETKLVIFFLAVAVIVSFGSAALAGSSCPAGEEEFEIEFTISPNSVCAGDEVTFSATITNTGDCTDIFQVPHKILFDLPKMRKFFVGKMVTGLDPGEWKSFSIMATIPDTVPPGTYIVVRKVKSNGQALDVFPAKLTIEECD